MGCHSTGSDRDLGLSFDVVRFELSLVHEGVDRLRLSRGIVVYVLVYGLVARIVVLRRLLELSTGSRTTASAGMMG